MSTEGAISSQPTGSRVGHRVFVRKVFIENFKSIERLEVELEPGVNLLVDPNASGKTNILEAVHFLYRVLVEEAGKELYAPHRPYPSGKHLIYGMDTDREVMLGLAFEHYLVEEPWAYMHYVDFRASFRFNGSTLVPVRYRISLTTPPFQDQQVVLDYSSEHIKVSFRTSYELMSTLKKLMGVDVGRAYRKVDGEFVFEKSVEDEGKDAPVSLDELRLLVFMPFLDPGKPRVPFAIAPISKRFKLAPKEAPFISAIGAFKIVVGHRGVTILEQIIPDPPGATPVFDLTSILMEVLRRIVFLRHPDVDVARRPQPLQLGTRLDERATNLAPVLLSLAGGREEPPERISEAIDKLFPSLKVRVLSIPCIGFCTGGAPFWCISV